MRRTLKKLVFVEPKSTHLHIYSRVCIPRLGSVLLATIMRAKGYDVRVYIEDIHDVDMHEVLSADLVAISAITSPSFTWRPAGPWHTSHETRACTPPASAFARSSWHSAHAAAPRCSGVRAFACSATLSWRYGP